MPDLRSELRVQVCRAWPDHVFLKDLVVSPGATIEQAIASSGLLQEEPALDLAQVKVGIHGKQKALDTRLRDGDRVEVYRPLLADPKDARRRRAVKVARSGA
jgi:uncharacterized protein